MLNYVQCSIFDSISLDDISEPYRNLEIIPPKDTVSNKEKYFSYDLNEYKNDISSIGLECTWRNIIAFVLENGENDFLSVENFTELYEIGLASQNKYAKKESGQYYTPDDVAKVMAEWFARLEGEAVCDVACGTGKLILTYLEIIGYDNARNLLLSGLVYLYDNDKTALAICKTIILCKYGRDVENKIHTICGDFLSDDLSLPKNCKVISNPPYAVVNQIDPTWKLTDVAKTAKELYAMFLEKIFLQSQNSVIITPYSFLGGKKFYPLREIMNRYNGFIVSFDNVPGNIFCGRKHGIFNTNTSNSVRAAITVVENKEEVKGFRLTPLIRFKNKERYDLLQVDILESFLDDKYQIIDNEHQMYSRCFKSLGGVWERWQNINNKTVESYVSATGEFALSIPNTCRYFTSAFKGKMNRNGQIMLSFDDEHIFNYVFCLMNSSFAYWYWRNYDGGITFPKGLLLNMPLFYDILSNDEIRFFDEMAQEMIECANKFTVTKKNVGIQENVKYPKSYRDRINRKLLDILGFSISEKEFDVVHSNMALQVNI